LLEAAQQKLQYELRVRAPQEFPNPEGVSLRSRLRRAGSTYGSGVKVEEPQYRFA